MSTPSIKISDLDFNQIKQSLKDFLKQKPEMMDWDFEGSGFAYIMDLLAYYGTYNAFYLNMVANEIFLDTAQLRDSVNARAKLLGYLPDSKKAARATLQINIGSRDLGDTSTEIYLPEDTTFTGRTSDDAILDFVISEPVTLYRNRPDGGSDYKTDLSIFPSGYYTGTITLIEGSKLTYDYTVIADENLDTKQRFIIPNKGTDLASLIVTVQESETNLTKHVFIRAEDITELTTESKVYYLQLADNELYEIYFGDGIVSAAVVPGNIVHINYIVCGGTQGNKIKQFSPTDRYYIVIPEGNSYNFIHQEIVLSESTGGENEESLQSIKANAPINYEMQNRAVTKVDFEQLLIREYPRIDSVVVWGGEDNDPPEYGRVFISMKPASGYYLDNEDKDYIINGLIKKRCTLTQDPVIVDPDYLYLVVNVEAKFNFKDSLLKRQEVQHLLYTNVQSFNETQLEKFGRGFVYSDFVEMIDNVDVGIQSNLTDIYLKKIIYPTLGRPENWEINFANSLSQYTEKRYYNKSIYSSLFKYVTDGTSCFFAEDSFGSSILTLYKIDPLTNANVKVSEMGTIDRSTGKINITKLFVPLGWYNNIRQIEFYAKSVIDDVSSARNFILVIDNSDIKVSVIDVDPFAYKA